MRHEPEDTTVVQNNWEVWMIFINAGWDVYLDRLHGFNEAIAIEFTLNLGEERPRVRGVEIPVTEEAIAEVSGLSQQGQSLFHEEPPSQSSPKHFYKLVRRSSRKAEGITGIHYHTHGVM